MIFYNTFAYPPLSYPNRTIGTEITMILMVIYGLFFITPSAHAKTDTCDPKSSVLNIHCFKAKGDGISDDTSKIQDVFTKAILPPSNSNEPRIVKSVYFPAGEYVINHKIDIFCGIRIFGDGIRSTIIRNESRGEPSFDINQNSVGCEQINSDERNHAIGGY